VRAATGCSCALQPDRRGHSTTRRWAVKHLCQTLGGGEYCESLVAHGWIVIARQNSSLRKYFYNEGENDYTRRSMGQGTGREVC
jgi:hypothetical protein